MSEVLVTGGSGFIGSHLVDTLCKRGDSVFNFDIVRPRPGALRHSFIRGSISYHYFHGAPSIFGNIFHLAANPWSKVKNPKSWIHEQQDLMRTNIYGTLRMLNQYPSLSFIFASTANLYGNGRKFKETDDFCISSPYGYSKAVCERMIAFSGRPYVIFRFGTVVGIRGRCFPNRLVWCAINNIPVKIFNMGDTYRDLIDVRDVVSAMLSAKDLEDGIYNISCGMEITGKVLAHQVFNEAHDRGHNLRYSLTEFVAPGYVPHSTLDTSKILDTGVWNPRITLKQTIADLFDYYEEKDSIEPPSWDKI